MTKDTSRDGRRPGRPAPTEEEFVEIEQNPTGRRDPEESRHNEAGSRVITQGDIEFNKLNQNSEGRKISDTQPQDV